MESNNISPILCQIYVRRSKRLRGQTGDWCHMSNRGNGEVSDSGYHSRLAHLLAMPRRLKVLSSSNAPGSGFRLGTTFVGFASQA